MNEPATLGAIMAAEIAEQPAVFDRILLESAAQIRRVAEKIERARPRFVVIAARGTSDHAALYLKYLVEVGLGLPAGLASPSTVTTFRVSPHAKDVLWVAVSQSGGSPDLIASTRAARTGGALTLAVTNNPASALRDASELGLDLRAGVERAVAATKTYTATLLTLWLLVDAWRGGDGQAARELPPLAEKAVGDEAVVELANRFRFAERMLVTGRGFSYPTAREAALKLMETSYLGAQAFSGADLLHGPLAMVDPGQPVLAALSPGAGGEAMGPVLDRVKERGGDVHVIGARIPGLPSPDVEVPFTIPELSPLIEIIPFQRLALSMAVARGHNPDSPRGLSKVTQTL
ncbi:SIS domain-containing protein [Phycicoccus sp. M110.8]|uniref:SIS domain-containing protein n=1 Tax=Phycicoccus sp. M110.8 TaxID=3075433 RepID=UPI0028FD909C|nr:SIS domain-containing protein [Phycicoccus sp. M110.8]MDU0313139.1 SIS domain-containing protein [Phycicoccus sp. M110.8]